jgi:hypothetical protein
MPRFRFQTEFAGNLDQLPDRHAVAVDQVAPPYSADLGIDAALDAHPEQATETRLGGNRRNRRSIGAVTNNDFGWAHLAGLGARPVRYSRFGLHVLLQPSGERHGPAQCSRLNLNLILAMPPARPVPLYTAGVAGGRKNARSWSKFAILARRRGMP